MALNSPFAELIVQPEALSRSLIGEHNLLRPGRRRFRFQKFHQDPPTSSIVRHRPGPHRTVSANAALQHHRPVMQIAPNHQNV